MSFGCQRPGRFRGPDNSLPEWRCEAEPQEVDGKGANVSGDLLCVRAGALAHPDNKLSGPRTERVPGARGG